MDRLNDLYLTAFKWELILRDCLQFISQSKQNFFMQTMPKIYKAMLRKNIWNPEKKIMKFPG